ncbi:hypothetical protein [Paenibacillus odorifer]|uniref:hypothetical protein n=1 Tax=Paenibacillus odorifer TaxID=189426 RepID=UPI0009700238|nr:hypothetical protein [Paenibacillus odorifer]OMD77813.1 hypothetical protein BSK50_11265 [Paenibacillus odorifer]OMD82739.1 hypothetical protein BSK53_16080 [Paenibacillus odorifer]
MSFENEFCKIVADDIPEKFKDSHLMFAIANPPIGGKPKEITISEIEDTIMNLDGVIEKINDYLIDEKVRKKYKNAFSKKVILFTLEYALVLGSFANIYNEIYKGKLYERIMNSIGGTSFGIE